MEEWLEQLLADINRGADDKTLQKKYAKQLGADPSMLQKMRMVGSEVRGGGALDVAVESRLGKQFRDTHLPKKEIIDAKTKRDNFNAGYNDLRTLYQSNPEEYNKWVKEKFKNDQYFKPGVYKPGSVEEDALLSRTHQQLQQERFKATHDAYKTNVRPKIAEHTNNVVMDMSNLLGKSYQSPQTPDDFKLMSEDMDAYEKKLKDDRWALGSKYQGRIPPEIQEKLKQREANLKKARKLYPSLGAQLSGAVLKDMAAKNPQLTSWELGKEIYKIMYPKQFAQYQDAWGDKPFSVIPFQGDKRLPRGADEVNRHMTQLGAEAKKLWGNKYTVGTALQEENDLKEKFTMGEQERVKHKIASALKRKGIAIKSTSGLGGAVFGLPGFVLGQMNKEKGATEEQIEVTAKEVLDADELRYWEQAKEDNNVNLPSTGLEYSFREGYHKTVSDAVKTTFSWLNPNMDRDRALENLQGDFSSNVLGELPGGKGQLDALREKREKGLADDDDLQQIAELEKYVDVRTRGERIKDMVGGGTGQLVALGTISAFTGGLASSPSWGRGLLSLAAPSGGRGGISAAAYLMGNEENAKASLRLLPGEGNGIKRFFHTQLSNGIDILAENVFPEEKFLRGLTKNAMARTLSQFSEKYILNAANSDGIVKALAKAAGRAVKGVVSTPVQETLEEEFSLVAKKMLDSVMTGEDHLAGLTLKEVVDTAEQSFWGASLIGLPGGVTALHHKKYALDSIWETATDPMKAVDVRNVINQMVDDKKMTKAEGEQKISLLNRAQAAFQNNPILSGDAANLSTEEKQQYFGRMISEMVKKDVINRTGDDKTGDTALRSQYEREIKESEQVRADIIKGKTKVNEHGDEYSAKGGDIYSDFDDTLFKDGKLTPLGEQLKADAAAGKNVTILTARDATRQNVKFIADTLGIPEAKVIAGLNDPKLKAERLTPGSTYYNENKAELEAGRQVAGVEVVDAKEGVAEVEQQAKVKEKKATTQAKRQQELEALPFDESTKEKLATLKKGEQKRYNKELAKAARGVEGGEKIVSRHKAEDVVASPESTVAERVAAKQFLDGDTETFTDKDTDGIQKLITEEFTGMKPGEFKDEWTPEVRKQKQLYDEQLAEQETLKAQKKPSTTKRQPAVQKKSPAISNQQQKPAQENKKQEKEGVVTYGKKDLRRLKADAKKATGKKKKALKEAVQSIKAMTKLFPDFTITTYDTKEQFGEFGSKLGATKKQASGRGGVYVDAENKQVHINLEAMNSEDVLHETAHPLLDLIAEHHPEIINKWHSQLQEIADSIPQAKEALAFAERYIKNGVSEAQAKKESIVQFLALIADGSIPLNGQPKSVLNKIKQLLSQIAAALGVPIKITDADSITAVAQKFSDAIHIGRQLTTSQFEINNKPSPAISPPATEVKKGEPVSPQWKFPEGVLENIVTGFSTVYEKDSEKMKRLEQPQKMHIIKNGKKVVEERPYVTYDKTLNDFVDKWVMIHFPDHAATGNVYKDKLLMFEGQGGVFYPVRFHEDGNFWAATDKTTANTLAKLLNDARAKSKDGILRMALVSSPPDKVLNSTSGSVGMVKLLLSKAFDDRINVSQKQMSDAFITAIEKLREEHPKAVERLAPSNAAYDAAYKSTYDAVLKETGNKEKAETKAGKAADKAYKAVKYDGKATDETFTSKLNPASLPHLKEAKSLQEMEQMMVDYYQPTLTSFAERRFVNESILREFVAPFNEKDAKGNFIHQEASAELKDLFQVLAKKKLSSTGGRVSANNLKDAMTSMMNEPMLAGLENNKIYAMLELHADVMPVQVTDQHKSYHYVLRSKDKDMRPIVHILQDRLDVRSNIIDPQTGKPLEADRKTNLMPPSTGISNEPVQIRKKTSKVVPQWSMNEAEVDDDVATEFDGKDGEANFNRWKGNNREVSGSEIQDVKTGEPIVAKVYHGTTHDFYEFDSTKKGNVEGHLGRINYFTSDYQDAANNYQAEGADITNRVDSRQERIEQDLNDDYMDESGNLDMDKVKEDYNVTDSDLESLYPKGVPDDISPSELSRHIAEKELKGGEEKVLELYTKLNNPVVLGKNATWAETIPESEYADYLEEAAQEIADENDIDIEDAKSDHDGEIRDRAIEMSGAENRVHTALADALSENGYDEQKASEILDEHFYETEVDLNSLEKKIREFALYENREGEMTSSQVIADFFKNLGHDGIILTDVSERFKAMGLGRGTSHVHVFDEYANQIKLADGSNVTFGETKNIQWSMGAEEAAPAKTSKPTTLTKLGVTKNETADSFIDKLIAHDGEFTDLLKVIKADPNFKNIKLEAFADLENVVGGQQGGLYHPEGGENAGLMQIADKGDAYYNGVHEMMHFLTLDSAAAEKVKGTASYKALEEMYNYIAAKKGVPSAFHTNEFNYGLANVNEFMAEILINKQFRSHVSDVFAKNFDEIKKTNKNIRDSRVTSVAEMFRNLWNDMLAAIVNRKGSGFDIDASKPVIENAAATVTNLFFPEKKGQAQWSMSPTEENIDKRLPVVQPGDTVDGREVRERVPNTASIDASLNDYTVLKGIREVPFTEFKDMEAIRDIAQSERSRNKQLANEIEASGEIAPLIVVYDADGAYVLEGSHRFDALRLLGATSFPAKVVIDVESFKKDIQQGNVIKIANAISAGIEKEEIAEELTKNQYSYEQAEALIDEANKLLDKSTPEKKSLKASIKESTDTTVKDTVTMNILDAIKKQIKDRMRGMREGFKEGVKETKAGQEHLEGIKDIIRKEHIEPLMDAAEKAGLFKGATVKASLFKSVTNQLSKVKTPYQLLKFADRLEKILKNVDYDKDLQTSKALKGRIRNAVKDAKNKRSAATKEIIKDFLKINPDSTEDIKEYIATAQKVLSVAEGIKVTATATDAKVKNDPIAISHDEMKEYTERQQLEAERQAAIRLAEMHDDLMAAGIIDPSNMSYKEMKEIVDAIASGDKVAVDKAADKLAAHENKMKALKAVAEYARIGLQEHNDSKPAFTKEEQKVVDNILAIDLDKLSGVQLARLIDTMNNIVVNDNFVGAGDVSVISKVQQNIKELAAYLKKANIHLTDIKSNIIKGLASNQLLIEFMAKSSKAAAEIQRLSGISGIFNGHAYAKHLQKVAVEGYADLKKKMSSDIDSAINKYRRGVYADVMNHFGGTQEEQQAEFDRRKIWIKETADRLSKSSVDKEKLEGKLVQMVYDELLEGSESKQDVYDKMDSIESDNITLVNYWQNEFKQREDKVKENAEIYNNKTFEDVQNYTATSLKGVNRKQSESAAKRETDMFAQRFVSNNLRVDPAGTKIAKSRQPKPTLNMVLDLDFDNVQSKKFYETNYDIETSEAVAQTKEFLASEEAEALLGGGENVESIRDSIQKSVALQRGQAHTSDKIAKAFVKGANILQGKAVRIALASLAQWPKQYLSVGASTVLNLLTDFNLFGRAMLVGTNLPLFDHFNIGQRGSTMAGYNKEVETGEIERALLGNNAEKTWSVIDKKAAQLSEFLMSGLVASDVKVARQSWLAFYMQSMKQQGIDINKIDWQNEHHAPNMQAAAYAEQMVSRSQNPNDASSMSNFSKWDKGGWSTFVRNTMLPFSTFSMNMRLRMTNDVQKIIHTNNKEAKIEAAKSLIATIAEQSLFNYLKVYIIGGATTWGAEALAGVLGFDVPDDDEEEKKKRKKFLVNTISDFFFSGLGAIMETTFREGVNAANRLARVGTISKTEDAKKIPDIFYSPEKSGWDYAGLYGIAPKKVIQVLTEGRQVWTGKTDAPVKIGSDIVERVDLDDKEKWTLRYLLFMDCLALAGLSEAEVSHTNDKLRRIMEKNMAARMGKMEHGDHGVMPKRASFK